jgi:hypothetical protein
MRTMVRIWQLLISRGATGAAIADRRGEVLIARPERFLQDHTLDASVKGDMQHCVPRFMIANVQPLDRLVFERVVHSRHWLAWRAPGAQSLIKSRAMPAPHIATRPFA